MASNRGYSSINALSRHRLIEAAGDLLGEEGYHSISARRIAERAGLKPQLVHYYFRTMEELVVAVFLKATEIHQLRHEDAVRSANPLRAFWDMNRHQSEAGQVTEYIALGKVFPLLREEMCKSGEHFRTLQTDAIVELYARRKIENPPISPAALGMLLASLARNFAIERECGMSGAHAELFAVVESIFKLFDPPAGSASGRDAAAGLALSSA